MKRKIIRVSLLTSLVFFVFTFALAFTPHYACACGQYEDGSQLTHIVNSISETFTGKPLVEKKSNPY